MPFYQFQDEQADPTVTEEDMYEQSLAREKLEAYNKRIIDQFNGVSTLLLRSLCKRHFEKA